MFYLTQYGKLLKPCFQDDIQNITMIPHAIEIQCSDKGTSVTELELSGIGVIGFRSNRPFPTKTLITVYLPKFLQIQQREALFPVSKEQKRNKVKKRHIKS